MGMIRHKLHLIFDRIRCGIVVVMVVVVVVVDVVVVVNVVVVDCFDCSVR